MYHYAQMPDDDQLSEELAAGYHEIACRFLAENQLKQTPQNYLLAYEYARGENRVLCDAVRVLLESAQPLLRSEYKSVFERHLVADVADAGEGLFNEAVRVMAATIEKLQHADRELGDFDEVIDSQQQRLSQPKSAEDVANIVETLSKATTQASDNTRHLQQDLLTVKSEADELREEIQRLREEAQTDGLTGLMNRKALEKITTQLDSNDADKQFSLLMLDIDHFKKINDSFGHVLGDQVIRRVAKTIKATIRGSDIAVRYGGEEYLVLLPETPLVGAERVAENIRATVADLRLIERKTDRKLPPFSVSIGVASRRGAESCDEVIERADAALYQSKQQGRNRYTLEADEPQDDSPIQATGLEALYRR